ncbi:hypothetical protein EDB84DRAFT_1549670 [Lactarius hengduanensis]|nr:hypothetical protein EDB84DRAFT_1549670 [Lactarius hengduanensis]
MFTAIRDYAHVTSVFGYYLLLRSLFVCGPRLDIGRFRSCLYSLVSILLFISTHFSFIK